MRRVVGFFGVLTVAGCAKLPPSPVAMTAEECYYGQCAGCENCSTKIGTASCYACCNSNCLSQATQCQELCDDRATTAIRRLSHSPEAANRYLTGFVHDLSSGRHIGEQDIWNIEFLRAASDSEPIRRLAMAILVEAWDAGLIDPDQEALIRDTVMVGLRMGDFGVRDSLYSLITDYGAPVDPAEASDLLVGVYNCGPELEAEIASARPSLSQAEVAQRAQEHRQEALDAMAALLASE